LTDWQLNADPIPADHACLPGHFPGDPLVPGTLILERVLHALRRQRPGLRLTRVVSAKFVSPLRPDQDFTIHFRERAGETGFECRRGETLIASGRLRLLPQGAGA